MKDLAHEIKPGALVNTLKVGFFSSKEKLEYEDKFFFEVLSRAKYCAKFFYISLSIKDGNLKRPYVHIRN